MIKFKSIFVLVLISIFTISYGQNCNCEKNFHWVKKTFEENDAGFQFVIDKKGTREYDNHNSFYLKKVKHAKNDLECVQLLNEWLRFFRTGHLGVILRDNAASKTATTTKQPKSRTNYWETLNIDLPSFEKYLNAKKENDFEGIWETQPYKIGIKKEGETYTGFIIESGAENWKKGEVKLKITKTGKHAKSTYYLRDKSAANYNNVELLGENYLQIGKFTLKRICPKLQTDELIENYIKLINSEKPFLEELNKSTLLLRIPTFDIAAKKDIDSVIIKNKEKILQSENLIIDIRNNGGGSDGSFEEILPFLYTNPIRTVGVEFYSTKLNNQRMLDFINKPEYGFNEDDKKWAKEAYDKLESNLGQFVNVENSIVHIDTFKTIYPNPQNIAIMINESNGSTAEQFLLAAKQSKKVKLFGTTTIGVLDISNMYFVKSPCDGFELAYSLSRSMRIPEMTIDNKGIQPDYYIDKSIPQYKWVVFVNEILNAE